MDSEKRAEYNVLLHILFCSHCNKALGTIHHVILPPLLCRQCSIEVEDKLTELRKEK